MSFDGLAPWVKDRLWYSQQQQVERDQAQARTRIREEKRSRAAAAERAHLKGEYKRVYMETFKREIAKPLPPTRQAQRTEWVPAPKSIPETKPGRPKSPAMKAGLVKAYLDAGFSATALVEALAMGGDRKTLLYKSCSIDQAGCGSSDNEQLIAWLAEHDPESLVTIANIIHEHDGN